MPDTAQTDLSAIARDWIGRFAACLAAGTDPADLLDDDCFWRDVLSATWGMETAAGVAAVSSGLAGAGLSGFALDVGRTAPRQVQRAGRDCLEAFIRFDAPAGPGVGVVRLIQSPAGDWRGWTVLTALQGLSDHAEAIGANRPTGQSNARDFRGPNWLDKRRARAAFDDRDPAVLIVGGGQAGLSIAARLGALGVDALIVDRHARVGDNWRLRYHALTLHNQVQVNHLPYMPFPPGWPTYIPKDKLANWFEAYVEAMELNYWTSTTFRGGTYDVEAGCWSVEVERDGTTRTMRPRHVVMATGVSGIPNRPEISQLAAFEGPVLHSSQYRDGEDWEDRHAVVFGTGNSGHDIAHDLCSSGAQVTLVQRAPTLIVNIEPSAQLPYALYDEGPPLEDCDLIVLGTPTELSRRTHQMLTIKAKEIDRELLGGLTARGFRLDDGENGTGWQFKYLTRGGGYYFNVGASDMIVAGDIDLASFDTVGDFGPATAHVGGTEKPCDLVVLATGYQPQEVLVERLFGAEVAERVGPIWGFGDGEELRNMYVRTPQPGLFFIAGSLAQCRINSKYLALQIKAIEEGLIDA